MRTKIGVPHRGKLNLQLLINLKLLKEFCIREKIDYQQIGLQATSIYRRICYNLASKEALPRNFIPLLLAQMFTDSCRRT